MIRNITLGLLCGLSGVGVWAITGSYLLWEKPWPFVTGVAWSLGVGVLSVFAFDEENLD